MRAYRQKPERENILPPFIEFHLGLGENAEEGRFASAQALTRRLCHLHEDEGFAWGEMALLFRSSTAFPVYEFALEAAGIPFLTIAGRGFHERPEPGRVYRGAEDPGQFTLALLHGDDEMGPLREGRPKRESFERQREGSPVSAPAGPRRESPGRERQASPQGATASPPPAALAGVRVIEMGQLIAGPFAGKMLGEFGADVIKIEPPGSGDPLRKWRLLKDGTSEWWQVQSRNKRLLALDLRVAEGQDVARRLIAEADVLIENFRPGTLEGWGLGWESLRALNPGLVMLRISGYGQTGPYRDLPGFGAIGEAMGGLRHLCGEPERVPVLTGVLSVGLYYLVYMASTAPLIGASGAIAGLMGAYTVLYGRRRIKVFYSLGFYFNYTRVPALVLLPLWIGNECFRLFFGGASHVAYVAHLGGLASGAALGFVSKKCLGSVMAHKTAPQDSREEQVSLLDEALDKLGKLDMDGARVLLERVLEKDPGNTKALTHMFHIDKLQPESERFHATASRLFRRLTNDKGEHRSVYPIFQEYVHLAPRLRLDQQLLFRISSALAAQGHPEDGERIMAVLLRSHPRSAGIPTGILNLARAYLHLGKSDRGRECLQVICRKYPESSECHIARKLLQGQTQG